MIVRDMLIGLYEVLTGEKVDDQYGTRSKKDEQKVGEYCKGKHLDRCTKTFGNILEQTCRTCPN